MYILNFQNKNKLNMMFLRVLPHSFSVIVRGLVISPPAFRHRKAARWPVMNGFTGRSLSTEAAENAAL